MTKTGFENIQTEIHRLWHIERPEIVRQVTAAAELGDRSENGAYIYGKKRLREIDSRLRYLRKKTEGIVVVDVTDQVPHDDVRFGAIVKVVDDNDIEKTWRMVDKDESEPKRQRISVQSPIGQALMGKEVGDYITVTLPKGKIGLEILEIRYGNDGP